MRFLDVPEVYQPNGYTCVSCCVKAALTAFGFGRIPLTTINRGIRCSPDGADFSDTARHLRRRYGLTCTEGDHKPRPSFLRAQLRHGALVIISIQAYNGDDHAVLATGIEPDGDIILMDPIGRNRHFSACRNAEEPGYLVLETWHDAIVACPWCRTRNIDIHEGPGAYECPVCEREFTV